MNSYGIVTQVRLLAIQQKHFHQDRYFPKPQEGQIYRLICSNQQTNIERLLRFIHSKYNDEGLRATLIHKLFDCKSSEIAYYVPELVYIAIKKDSKHIKKLLVFHAKNSFSMRRLILWNVKAFTVMIKQKSREVKKKIEEFQEALISTVYDRGLFTNSLKAIAMLTEASLTLKKQANDKQKDKLKQFIKKFNSEYLSNVDHRIIIPFRHHPHQKHDSDYVVGIVVQECSCFPTRKRVPYRIIIETIDLKELQSKRPDQGLFQKEKTENESQKDFYSEVNQSVDKMFQMIYLNMPTDNHKLFVVDSDESRKFSEMKNYYKNIQKKEEQEKEQFMERSMSKKSTLGKLGALTHSDSKLRINDLGKYRIQPSQELSKFEAIYIPDIRGEHRKSDHPDQNMVRSYVIQHTLEDSRKRKSDKFVQQETKNVKIYEQNVKEIDEAIQSFFGKPWNEKKEYYKKKSYFRKFDSLKMRNVVVKGGDDLRQQIICMQLIYKMKEIISEANIQIFIKPYEIIVLSENSGILEFVSNSISVDSMKKKYEEDCGISIYEFFCNIYPTQEKMERALSNFVSSLVGSSIMTFVLKLKDRHNGNILLDKDGHIIHIDFGFILGMSPGNMNFQKSPFKFTTEYLQVLEGKGSKMYKHFSNLFCQGMKALRDRADELSLLLEIMMEDSDLDCFKHFDLKLFMNQFKRHYSQERFTEYCEGLIEESCENRYTVYYDNFQQYSNGIMI